MQTAAGQSPSELRATPKGTARITILGCIVAILGLLVAGYEFLELVGTGLFSPGVHRTDGPRLGAAGAIAILSVPVLIALLLFVLRLRNPSHSPPPTTTSRALRSVRFCTVTYLAQEMLQATLLDGSREGLGLMALICFSIALCLLTSLLLLFTRNAITRLCDQPAREHRGFQVLLPGAPSDASVAPASAAFEETYASPWAGLATLLAAAMAAAYATDVATFWKMLMRGSVSFNYIVPYPSVPGMPTLAPAIPPEIFAVGAPLALGACGFFWLTWLITCLAGGPRWRWVAIAFVIFTLVAQALQVCGTILVPDRGWAIYSRYTSTMPLETVEFSALSILTNFALPTVVLCFLARRDFAAAFRPGQ